MVLGSVNSALLFIGSKNPNPPLSETLGNGYSWNGVRLHLCLNISGQCTTATTQNKEEKWCIEKIKLSGTNWWNIVFYSYVYGIGVCIYIYNIVNFISKYTRYFKSIIFFFFTLKVGYFVMFCWYLKSLGPWSQFLFHVPIMHKAGGVCTMRKKWKISACSTLQHVLIYWSGFHWSPGSLLYYYPVTLLCFWFSGVVSFKHQSSF